MFLAFPPLKRHKIKQTNKKTVDIKLDSFSPSMVFFPLKKKKLYIFNFFIDLKGEKI